MKTCRDSEKTLERWIETTGDRGAEPEGDAEYIKELQAGKQLYYERGMKRRGLDPKISNRDYLNWWKKQLGVTHKRAKPVAE